MATSQIEVESRVTELATQALKAFCDDISGTFGVDIECEQREIATEIVASLQQRFNKLVAVNVVDSEGLLSGTFRFIFDQEGLFTLGGIIIMLPEEQIMSNRQNTSTELAESMVDTIGEVGNLLVGSWDRVFSDGLEGHNHFSNRLPSFVGRPWDKSEETIGLAGDEEVFFIPYEMTVGSYPAFNCGVIFPKTIFGESSDFVPEQTTMVEQATQEETEENTQDMQTATEKIDSEEPDKESDIVEGNNGEESQQEQPSAEETPVEATDAGEIAEQAQTGQVPEDTADSQDATAAVQSEGEESQQEQPSVEETPAEATDAGEIAEQAQTEQVPEDTADSENAAAGQSNGEESKQEQPSAEETPAEATDAGEIAEQAQTGQVPEDTADTENAAAGQSNAEESQQEQPSAEETPVEATDAGEIAEQAQTGQVPEDTADTENAAAGQSNAEESQLREPDVSPDQEDTAPDPNAANNVAEETAAASETSEESATGKIFEAIRKITQSPAILPGQSAMAKNEIPGVTGDLFEIRANDIMQNKVTWVSPDDSLQQALAKMKQTDAGYIMIGQNRVLEGIVSQSDITRAMSPYLQPIFAKWRRPLDDATLKIRIKWIMSRPVRTIKPETSLAAIMEYMSQFRGRCLPVTDEAGNVHGLVTAFDIFKALLKSSFNTPAEDQRARALAESAGESRTA